MSLSESPSCSFTMEDIPSEIVRHIFLCLDKDDWKSVLLVCKGWYFLGMRVFVEVLIYKGTRLLQLKNYKRSIKYFDQVLAAIVLVSKRESIEIGESKSIFSLSIGSSTPPLSEEFVTKQSRVLNNKAVALMNLRKHEEAIECLKEVLKMKPDHVKAMNNLGDNLNSLQKYEEAIEMFNKALVLDPHRLSVLYNKGNSYLHMKRYHEAIEWYDKAIQVSPKDVDSLGNKAIALYRLGCYKEAIKYFDEVLVINPKDKIALRYKDFVTEEMRKKQTEEVNLNQINLERKKEMDFQKRPDPIVFAVLGGTKVGKTSMVGRITRANLGAVQSPEIVDGNKERCTLDIDGEWCMIDVIDVDAPIESKQFYTDLKKADGFMLMYDIGSEESFDSVIKCFKCIKKAKGNHKDIPVLLIGNKVDMKQDRAISYEKGRSMAEDLQLGFVETSTTTPINVKYSVDTLAHKIIKQKEEAALQPVKSHKKKDHGHANSSTNSSSSTSSRTKRHHNCQIS